MVKDKPKFKVGDKVICRLTSCNVSVVLDEVGTVKDVEYDYSRDQFTYGVLFGTLSQTCYEDSDGMEAVKPQDSVNHPSQNTGGPATYYDLPFWEWQTLNDMLEHLAVKQWGAYSLHFKDMAKALVRFGVKTGTSKEYDIEKMIYSGCRAMVMLSGKESLREYLKRLLDDPQFK